MRVMDLFTMEFEGLARRIEENSSWINLLVWMDRRESRFAPRFLFLQPQVARTFYSRVEPVDTPRDVITKLYRIAQNIPPAVMTQETIVMTIEAQLHRYVPQSHDRMNMLHNNKDGVPKIWLGELINLPNRGYELGQVVTPKPIDIIRVPRHEAVAGNDPTIPHATIPPLNQTVNQINQKTDGSCYKCGREDHWAYQCHSGGTKFRRSHWIAVHVDSPTGTSMADVSETTNDAENFINVALIT